MGEFEDYAAELGARLPPLRALPPVIVRCRPPRQLMSVARACQLIKRSEATVKRADEVVRRSNALLLQQKSRLPFG
jgi:hypothetical protein